MLSSIKRALNSHRIKSSVREAANHLSNGNICLFPSQGVYTLILDGNNIAVVERLRKAKGRDLTKREGLISPPERINQLIDFSLLNQINPDITPEVVKKIYKANPVGLVVTCKEELVPKHLITYVEIKGKKIPTVMNIWNSDYKLYKLLWKELSKTNVLWAGSSSNLTNQGSLNFEDSCRVFGSTIAHALKDPELDNHKFQGSYTMISLIENPPKVLRMGSVHPEKHPEDFQRFKEVLPNLEI